MASNLYTSLMGINQQPQPQPQNQDMLSAFTNFKQQMAGKDPKSMVEELISTGQMSKEQFQQLGQRANSLRAFLK